MFLSKISFMVIYYLVEENIFCRYCLETFITEELLKRHIKKCFKIDGKQRIKVPKKMNMLDLKILKEK